MPALDRYQRALGQFALYSTALEDGEPDRLLFLAVDNDLFLELFENSIGRRLIKKLGLRVIVFNPIKEEIVQWKPEMPNAT